MVELDTAPLLRLEGLTTELTTGRGLLRAVDRIDLEVGKGECIGIVGESGSGKSILMRSIMGIEPINAEVRGVIRFEDANLKDLDRRALRALWGPSISMVFQDPMTSLNPVRRIVKQITDPIRHHLDISRSDAVDKAEHLLRLVGIPEPRRRLSQFPHELSGGMRQRVGIAIALSCEPKLLIADEPTTALDVTVQKQILDLLDEIRQSHEMSMMLVTHDMSVVAGRTDRVAVMYAGRIIELARTAELFDSPRHPYTRALLSAIPRIDVDRRVPLQAIAGQPPDMVSPPPGCRFAPRCAFATDECRTEFPPLVVDDGGHRVECFHPRPDDEPYIAATDSPVALSSPEGE